MAIPEDQLETWSHIGSIQQSAQTYETIRSVLDDKNAPYYPKYYSIFLQGSYGNNTNVYKESDVDVVMCLTSTVYAETSALNAAAKANYERNRTPADYGFSEFKAEVLKWLTANFGKDVVPGKKAISIKGTGSRRDADVLVCVEHHEYRSDSNGVDGKYHEGIRFYLSDWTEIVNFPKQHADNCKTKHKNTNSMFKPVVRIYKNMRNRMADDGVIKAGLAPSYFIEGMLSNVPPNLFTGTYQNAVINTFNWVNNADTSKLTCANGIHWLVRDTFHECWPTANFIAYKDAVIKYWENWS